MAHLTDMLQRLPQLYREGEIVSGLIAQAATQIEILDEDAREVQRAHWFNSALEIEEAEMLAALLDIKHENWQVLGEYRAWVHALRDALLKYGAVTVRAAINFAASYTNSFQRALDFRTVLTLSADPEDWFRFPTPIDSEPPPPADEMFDHAAWLSALRANQPALVENPTMRRLQRAPDIGGIEPLHRFSVKNRGLDSSFLGALMVGLPSGPEYAPALINLTTGEGIVFLGAVPPGARLWLNPDQDGLVTGILEGEDVSHKLRSIEGITPGTAWSAEDATSPARAPRLVPGDNDLWFLPIAHYDVPGLDRFLLALADLTMHQGRWDQTNFDHSLFYQDPAAQLHVGWEETRPACYRIDLPAGWMTSPAPSPGEEVGEDGMHDKLAESLAERQRLEFSLNEGIDRLRPAGVEAEVVLHPFREVQGHSDRMTGYLPRRLRDPGPGGAVRLVDGDGMFDVSEFNKSIFDVGD